MEIYPNKIISSFYVQLINSSNKLLQHIRNKYLTKPCNLETDSALNDSQHLLNVNERRKMLLTYVPLIVPSISGNLILIICNCRKIPVYRRKLTLEILALIPTHPIWHDLLPL